MSGYIDNLLRSYPLLEDVLKDGRRFACRKLGPTAILSVEQRDPTGKHEVPMGGDDGTVRRWIKNDGIGITIWKGVGTQVVVMMRKRLSPEEFSQEIWKISNSKKKIECLACSNKLDKTSLNKFTRASIQCQNCAAKLLYCSPGCQENHSPLHGTCSERVVR